MIRWPSDSWIGERLTDRETLRLGASQIESRNGVRSVLSVETVRLVLSMQLRLANRLPEDSGADGVDL